MSLVDGEGKPIPPDSWGGDLDAPQQMHCADCGVAIPFGKFCPEHLNAARAKNEEILAKQLAADPQAAARLAALREQQDQGEVDMTVAMAKAQERAQQIVTPGATIEPDVTDHLSKSGPAGAEPLVQPATPAPQPQPQANLIMPAAATERIGLKRRGDEFLIGQAIMWIGELRGLAEEGKVPPHLVGELLQINAELTYALAGMIK